MICKVTDTIDKYGLLNGISCVAVGVSGGADSMCLLEILSSLKDKYGIILKAVHVNHNLRGEEALRDENLVRDFCKEKGIELSVYSVDINSLSAELGVGTEECGRKVRYECFDKAGCDAVAVAHSLSDSIETTVYNLIRGTGTKGLCGIPVSRKPNIIRPLIFCLREEIESYCKKEKIPYINDSSNFTDDYTRNYIRHNIIPSFEKVNPSFAANILRSGMILREENDFIEKTAFELINKSAVGELYDAESFSDVHPAVRKRAILILLSEKMKKQPLYVHTELVNSIIENKGGKVELSTDLFAKVENGRLSFLGKAEKAQPWAVDFVDFRAEGPYGTYFIVSSEFYNKNDAAFDGEKIKGQLVLTSRRSGDSFVFKRRNISKSLKKLFNEMKIPADEREKVAVMRDSENIIWVEGVGVNADYIPDKNCKKIFIIKKEG